jgi:hypothetical protein
VVSSRSLDDADKLRPIVASSAPTASPLRASRREAGEHEQRTVVSLGCRRCPQIGLWLGSNLPGRLLLSPAMHCGPSADLGLDYCVV